MPDPGIRIVRAAVTRVELAHRPQDLARAAAAAHAFANPDAAARLADLVEKYWPRPRSAA